MKQTITHLFAAGIGGCLAALLTIQINSPVLPRNYQIEASDIGYALYDNSRPVGFISALDTASQLHKLITNDNK